MTTRSVSPDYSLVLTGSPDADTTVLFEPGAGEFVLKPGEWFRIDVTGPDNERIEIAHGRGYVSVWPSPAVAIKVVDSGGDPVRLIGY